MTLIVVLVAVVYFEENSGIQSDLTDSYWGTMSGFVNRNVFGQQMASDNDRIAVSPNNLENKFESSDNSNLSHKSDLVVTTSEPGMSRPSLCGGREKKSYFSESFEVFVSCLTGSFCGSLSTGILCYCLQFDYDDSRTVKQLKHSVITLIEYLPLPIGHKLSCK